MLPTYSLKCSWSLIAAVVSLVALLSLLHLFLSPFIPSPLDCFSFMRANSSSSPTNLLIVGSESSDENLQLGIDFDSQFPAESHGEVIYRGAPWKPEIGRWLSRCGSVSTVVDVVEKLAKEFGSTPNMEGKLGRQHTSNVIVSPIRSVEYHNELLSSIFCGVLPRDGWSGRMEDSILQGCIPVIIQDGILLPYENVLNYKSFAVRINEDDIPNLIRILQRYNDTEIDFMLANIRKIWQRFLYRDSILLEARRQKKLFGDEESWAAEFSRLEEDDVFSTFLQVLHCKLHNDEWRRHHSHGKKFRLPKACLRTTQ